jgi:hypothetical protein
MPQPRTLAGFTTRRNSSTVLGPVTLVPALAGERSVHHGAIRIRFDGADAENLQHGVPLAG